MRVPVTAMPQRIALSLTLSALAATLVGVAEYHTQMTLDGGVSLGHAKMAALGFEIMLGSITVGGTLIAAGKLQEVITSKPVTYAGQNYVNGGLFLALPGPVVYVVANPPQSAAFYLLLAGSLPFSLMLLPPLGRAHMPALGALPHPFP